MEYRRNLAFKMRLLEIVTVAITQYLGQVLGVLVLPFILMALEQL